MQILKEDIKEKLHKAAINEFREKGFEKSSMRNIAKNSGITVGNIYRYYKNKESLFSAIIKPTYDKIVALINEEKQCNFEEAPMYRPFLDYLTNSIIDIYRNHKDELPILFMGSEGTEFENAKNEIIELTGNQIKKYIFVEMQNKGLFHNDDLFLVHVISVGFIEGIATIFKSGKDENKIRDLVFSFQVFYFQDIIQRFNI